MGARAPSFALRLPATVGVAANAAIAFGASGPWQPRVVVAGHEVPTTITQHYLAYTHPNGDHYGSLRPTSGDWPVGTLDVYARSGYGDHEVHTAVTITPARQEMPRCEAIAAPVMRTSPPLPMMASYDFVAIDHGPVVSTHGPFVSCIVTHESGRFRRRRTTQATLVFVGEPGTIQLHPPMPDRIVGVRFVDLAGATLTLTPPFPIGAPPNRGPFGT